MGQVLHGSARTTEAVRRAIQHSEESLRALAKWYQSEDRCQVEEAYSGQGFTNRSKGSSFHGAEH
jgi:hypothetical protein